MKIYVILLIVFLLMVCCGKEEMKYWERVELGNGLTRTHILSVICKSDDILVGTYGKGALFSDNGGKTWRRFQKSDKNDSSELSGNFISGGDWKRKNMILATIGNGFNFSSDNGNTWLRFDQDFFGTEYLYTTKTLITNKTYYVATGDGIIYFEDNIDPTADYEEQPYQTIDEQQGVESQYIYDIAVEKDNIYLGTLHGFSFSADKGKSWSNFSPNNQYTKDGQADCKVKAVAVKKRRWYAGCDDGFYYSTDEGVNWVNISRGLPSLYIHDILIDRDDNLWVATYKGVAFSENYGQSYKVYGKTSGFYGENINCLAQSGDGNIYAGTNFGLYHMVDKIPIPNFYPVPQAQFSKAEKLEHPLFLRPIPPDENYVPDQTYLYGTKRDGDYRQHQGCDYNNPEGIPVRAVDDGSIVFINKRNGHLVLKCNTRFEDKFIYAHYYHLDKISGRLWRNISRGDLIGSVGKKGDVNKEHLHFEISLSEYDDSNVPNETVNPELWLKPLPNCGIIAGNVEDTAGYQISGVKIYGVEKPVPIETPFMYAQTYCDSVNAHPAYEENFIIGDVPAGEYLLRVEYDNKKYAVKANVKPAKITRVKIVVN